MLERSSQKRVLVFSSLCDRYSLTMSAAANCAVFDVFRRKIMNRFAASLIAFAFSFSAGSAFSADNMKKDTMTKDGMKKESMAKEDKMKKEMPKDGMMKDEMKKDMPKEGMKQEKKM